MQRQVRVMSTPFSKVYLDNNATTEMPQEVIAAMAAWSNQGNPSSGFASAEKCRQLMMDFRRYIGRCVGVQVCCEEDRDTADLTTNYRDRRDKSKYKVIITSGASESNSAAITGIIAAYNHRRGPLSSIPNIVMSAIEHKSVIKCVDSLVRQGLATVTRVNPDVSGVISVDAVSNALQSCTVLVCVMAANNETGAINDISRIGRLCRDAGVHYHCDAVQIFGKYPPQAHHCDSMSLSFHKLHGPPGVGVLLMRQSTDWIPLIHGSQNEELRGGTENIPGIAGAYLATTLTLHDRGAKNERLLGLKRYAVQWLAQRHHVCSYARYSWACRQNAIVERQRSSFISGTLASIGLTTALTYTHMPNTIIVLLSTVTQCLPNTLLLSVVNRKVLPSGTNLVCNATMKKQLESAGVIVSVGSACNTADPKASHVLYALGADTWIRSGCLRISMGDSTTRAHIDTFLQLFSRIVRAIDDV